MELTMNRMIFIKEVFLKNDLTYLTLCYFLFMATLKIDSFTVAVPFVLSAIHLSIGWYFSIVKKNIFNSAYKLMIIPALAIFVMNHFTPMSSLEFSGMTHQFNGVFVLVFTLMVFYVGTSLITTEKENKYAKYEANNRSLETEYLKNTYRSLTYNNAINYHYDERVNLYVFDDSMHSAGNSLFVKESDKKVVGSLPDYYRYFKDLNMDYNSMNEDSLEVFKMYAI